MHEQLSPPVTTDSEAPETSDVMNLPDVKLGYNASQSYGVVLRLQAAPIVNRLVGLKNAQHTVAENVVIARYTFTEDPSDVLNDEIVRRDYLTRAICDLAKAAGLQIQIDQKVNERFMSPVAFADALWHQSLTAATFPEALTTALAGHQTETDQALQAAKKEQQDFVKSLGTEPAPGNESDGQRTLLQRFRTRLAAMFPNREALSTDRSTENRVSTPQTPDFVLTIYAENANEGLFKENQVTHTISLVAAT